jgi:hypothetical protein
MFWEKVHAQGFDSRTHIKSPKFPKRYIKKFIYTPIPSRKLAKF